MTLKYLIEVKPRFIWLLTGYALVALVIYLSLTSHPVDMGMDFSDEDKLYHFIAYFTLMAWFAYPYHERKHRYKIALAFVLLGILLEYLQGFSAARYFEYGDMLANLLGVAAGFVVMLIGKAGCLKK